MDSLFDDIPEDSGNEYDRSSLMDIEEEEIQQEEVWKVIDEYFNRKG